MARINIFAAGGAGINLVMPFLKFKGQRDPGFAEFVPFLIDTSRSNLPVGYDEDSIFIVPDVDGSGKKRDSNYRIIAERTKEILHKFKPGDINVVIHSASGGSGSVFGPTIVSELLERKAPTIVIMVGGSDSRIEANNTINTLKSYEVISQKREVPVIAAYFENSKEMSRGQVDQRIKTTLVLLAAVFSGENRELDSADLANFLNYTRVTSFKPKLSYLDFFSRNIEVGRDQSVVSLVTLTNANTDSAPNVHVEYQATGFIGDAAQAAIDIELPIHTAVVSGYYHDVIDRLETRLKAIDESRNAHVEKSIVGKHEETTDEGLIL